MLSEDNDDYTTFKSIINDNIQTEMGSIDDQTEMIFSSVERSQTEIMDSIRKVQDKKGLANSEQIVRFCNEMLVAIMASFKDISIKNFELFQRFNEISLVVSFFVFELFRDDQQNKNKQFVKKFLISNNIQCDSLLDVHPVENIKESRITSVKYFRDQYKNNENNLVENDKNFNTYIDNGYWNEVLNLKDNQESKHIYTNQGFNLVNRHKFIFNI